MELAPAGLGSGAFVSCRALAPALLAGGGAAALIVVAGRAERSPSRWASRRSPFIVV